MLQEKIDGLHVYKSGLKLVTGEAKVHNNDQPTRIIAF